MRMLLSALALSCALITALPATARPVSYPGGWTFMTMNDGAENMLHFNYTFTPQLALGYVFGHDREDDSQFHGLQGNILLHRWNRPESQGNLYLLSALGQKRMDGDSGFGGFTGLAADWEDRRYYVSYRNRYTDSRVDDGAYTQAARIGIAPYVADYGQLHTWVMLEASHRPEGDETFTLTPLVRLFKGDHLVEAGLSNHGEALFNWTIRF